MSSQQASKAAAWLNHQVEKEGIARLTIVILLLTTIAMLAYTWGYAEGVHNSQSELAQDIRLNTRDKMPSIAELRHGSSSTYEQQETEAAGASIQHDAQPAAPAPVQAANTSSSSDSKPEEAGAIVIGTVTEAPPLPADSGSSDSGRTIAEGSTDAEGSSGRTDDSTTQGQETTRSTSSSTADGSTSSSTGDGSSSSSSSSGRNDEQPHSRSDDGSEGVEVIADGKAAFEEYDEGEEYTETP